MADIKLKAIHSIVMSKGRTAEPGVVFSVEKDEGEYLVEAGAAVYPGAESDAAPAEADPAVE